MTARRVGCYSLAGLIGTLVAAVTNYAAGETNRTPNSARVAPQGGLAIPGSAGQATASSSLRAACSGDGTEVDASALGSAEDAATEAHPRASVAAHHEARQ